jgi:type I site-specific restriction-modification system R (restriction) subunit
MGYTKDVRKVLITTIHKFGEAGGRLNERSNIIVMVDEAHRTQEGDLGRKMREALPNAFLFGLTGTPINRADRNTFWAFGADEDEKGYNLLPPGGAVLGGPNIIELSTLMPHERAELELG